MEGNLSGNGERLALRKVRLSDLVEDPQNARTHDARNLEGIRRSLENFGQREPLVVRDGVVIGGNGRLRAMRELGWAECWVTDHDDLTPAQARALGVVLNRTAEVGTGWDAAMLKLAVEEVALECPEIELDVGDVPALAVKPEVTEDDGAPDPLPEAKAQRGDIIALGPHRVMCGDSTSAEDVGALLAGERASLCMTDPPYGADIQYADHDDTQDALVGLIAGFLPMAMDRSDVVALTPGINNLWLYPKPDWLLCWFYGAGTGRSPWGFTAWQPFMVWGKCPKLAAGEGCHPDGFQWMMSRDDAEQSKLTGHACPKPLSVWRRFMDRLSNKSTEIIWDPFGGSGTTLIAADQLGFSSMLMEFSPRYVDVIVRRWIAYCEKAGKDPQVVGWRGDE